MCHSFTDRRPALRTLNLNHPSAAAGIVLETAAQTPHEIGRQNHFQTFTVVILHPFPPGAEDYTRRPAQIGQSEVLASDGSTVPGTT